MTEQEKGTEEQQASPEESADFSDRLEHVDYDQGEMGLGSGRTVSAGC